MSMTARQYANIRADMETRGLRVPKGRRERRVMERLLPAGMATVAEIDAYTSRPPGSYSANTVMGSLASVLPTEVREDAAVHETTTDVIRELATIRNTYGTGDDWVTDRLEALIRSMLTALAAALFPSPGLIRGILLKVAIDKVAEVLAAYLVTLLRHDPAALRDTAYAISGRDEPLV